MLKFSSADLFESDLFGAEVRSSDVPESSVLPSGLVGMAQQLEGYEGGRCVQQVSAARVLAALQRDAVARRVMTTRDQPSRGDLVGVRLNLNVLKSTGVAVHSVHRGKTSGGHREHKGFWTGEVLCYAQTVTLRRAFFNVHQAGREAIASGKAAKHPMASVDGELYSLRDCADFGGLEVRFNPRLVHLFVDGGNRAVRYADEVTLLGNRCYLRGRIVYFDEETWVQPKGPSDTLARPASAVRRSGIGSDAAWA